MPPPSVQDLTERFTFLTDTPVALAVTSLSRVGTTATANTAAAHGFTTGDFVTIAGAVQAAYNGEVQVTVVDSDTFTYQVSGAPASPATGTVTAIFTSDAQGGQGQGWRTAFTTFGALEPLSASEVLQAQAISSQLRYRAVIRYRADVTPKMRMQWTPYRASTARTLEIHGVLPHRDDPRGLLTIDCGEVQ